MFHKVEISLKMLDLSDNFFIENFFYNSGIVSISTLTNINYVFIMIGYKPYIIPNKDVYCWIKNFVTSKITSYFENFLDLDFFDLMINRKNKDLENIINIFKSKSDSISNFNPFIIIIFNILYFHPNILIFHSKSRGLLILTKIESNFPFIIFPISKDINSNIFSQMIRIQEELMIPSFKLDFFNNCKITYFYLDTSNKNYKTQLLDENLHQCN